MKTDGLFTAPSFTYATQYNKPFKLIVFGDVHRDSPNHADKAWQDFLKYARAQQNALFLGMGDYIDSASTSERACLVGAGLHESTQNDLAVLAQQKVELLAKELGFMRGKLLGLLNGNHYYRFSDGGNSDMRLCRELQCQYLGVSTLFRLYIKHPSGSGKHSLDIFAHHGAGGSRLVGGSMNRVSQMTEHAEADIFLMGHDHKRGVIPQNPKIRLEHSPKGGLVVKSRQQWLGRSGSFLASYKPGTRDYNVDAARGPCSLGHIEFEITPAREQSGGQVLVHIDIRGVC